MDALILLSEAEQAGLTVEAHDGDLRVRGPRTAAAMIERLREHKGELLAALAGGGATAPVVEGLNGRDVKVLHKGPPVGIGLGDEHFRPHDRHRVGVCDLEGLPAGGDQPERLERVAVQHFSNGLLSAHAHILPIQPGGDNAPANRAPVAPDAEPVRSASWVPGHALAGERPGWTPEGWRDRLLYLAMRCENDRPERAQELRQAAEAMLTGQPALPPGVETIGDIVARVVPWAKYFRKPG